MPTKVGDVYQITSGAELKGFADLVNGEEPGAKGILTKNITLNEPGTMRRSGRRWRFQLRRLHRRL